VGDGQRLAVTANGDEARSAELAAEELAAQGGDRGDAETDVRGAGSAQLAVEVAHVHVVRVQAGFGVYGEFVRKTGLGRVLPPDDLPEGADGVDCE